MTGLYFFEYGVDFPAAHEPEWRDQVERWYQLDAASFALTESYWQLRDQLPTPLPNWMLLASAGGSNLTDTQFAASVSTQPSPAKFVHTLPNIRSASLLQIMRWSGQVLCLQNDPQSLLTAVSEGMHLVEAGEGPVWVCGVRGVGSRFTSHIFVLNESGPLKIRKSLGPHMANAPARDRDLVTWLNSSEQDLGNFIADGFEVLKSR